MAQQVIDMAMQLHGGGGLSDDFPLAAAWTAARSLRLADGPDEVHRGVVARLELGKYGAPMRRVLVTGAASGLGAALTAAFARAGDEVLATGPAGPARRPRPLRRCTLRRRLGGRARARRGDLGRPRRAGQQRRASPAAGGSTWRRWTSGSGSRDQPVRGGPRHPDLRAAVQAAAVGPVVNVASLAGLVHPAGHGVLQRGQGRRRRAHRDHAATSSRRTACARTVVCPSYFRTNLMASMRGADDGAGRGDVAAGRERRRSAADDIAAAVLAGIDRDDELIVPDRPARDGVAAQAAPTGRRTTRVMRAQAAKLEERDCSDRPTAATRPSRSARRTRSTSRRWPAGCASTPTAFRDDLEGTPEVRQFPGGASNLTYLLRYPGPRPDPAPAAGRGEGGERARHGPRVPDPVARWRRSSPTSPRMVGFCDDEAVIGSDFYVMERLDGTILRRDLPGRLTRRRRRRRCASNALDVLVDAALRRRRARAGLATLGQGRRVRRAARSPAGPTASRRARTDDTGDWSDSRWPGSTRTSPPTWRSCVIHNDFRFDNVVLDADDPLRIVGVLDWEMATVGDPLMDLGGALAYWVEADDDEFFQPFRRQPTTAPGMLTRERDRRALLRADGLRGHARAVAVLRGVRAVPARRDRPADLLPLPPRADHQRGVRRLRPGRGLPRGALPPAGRPAEAAA